MREMAAGTSAREQQQGMQRRVMAGRRGAAAAITPSTPVPSWSVFNGQLYDGVMAARSAPPASARKLAASLWELQLLDSPLPAPCVSAPRSPDWPSRQDSQREDFGVSAQTREHLRKLLRKAAAMEPVERQRHKKSAAAMEEGLSQELLKVLSQIRVLEEEHSSSLSLTSALHAELVAARARVRELEGAARREKKERARVAEERGRLKSANRRLARELADAQAALETERRQRLLMEDVCQELAQERGGDQAAAAATTEAEMELEKAREKLEEERRMLQLAEVWREERVQMKLGEAKLALEEKSATLNAIKDELESFLRTSSSDSNLRDAQVLHQLIHAISAFPTSDFIPESSTSSTQVRKPREDAPVFYAEGIPDAD